jgi:squalene-associated FAD-dependent desaturase
MKKIIVAGGGFAGLAAASLLCEQGHRVTLYESSPKLGGRAYSFQDKQTGDFIDNGQHILMGCYGYTLDFLEKIGARKNFKWIYPLRVNYVERGGRQFRLDVRSKLYPFNFLGSVLRFGALPFRKRLKLLLPFISLLAPLEHRDLNIIDWLRRYNQDDEIIKVFWELLTVSALNSNTEKVSAEQFKEILKIIFLSGGKNSAILIPSMDLTKTYVYYAGDFIERRGGRIKLSEGIKRIEIAEGKAVKVVTDKSELTDFDEIVLAVPSFKIPEILEEKYLPQKISILNYSPIVTLHLWLNNNPFTEPFYGLIDSKVHWLFNHESHITLVSSAAENLTGYSKEDLERMLIDELKNYFPVFYPDLVIHKKIIIEKRAAFAVTPEVYRSGMHATEIARGIHFAGDWTDTGLPSTIESAVKSAYQVARMIEKSVN